jgi:hypothetical protein
MSASHQEVDEIIILVDLEDPMTYDTEFQNRIQYGGFVKDWSEFTADTRETIRKNQDDDELTNSKFFIEVYTDRLADFVQAVLCNHDWQRALIFREERVIGPDLDEAAEMSGSDLEESCTIHHYYELQTIARMPFASLDIDEEDEEDEDADSEEEEEVDTKMAAEFDKYPSLFVCRNKTVH